MSKVYELNMDGLVGPTHHYAGLAEGNKASTTNALSTSNPQAAALQGLEKMRLLFDMGLKQGVLPPHQRPNLQLLHQLGFKGSPAEQITKAYKKAPQLLSASFSASSMWTANAATVSASLDTEDHKVHFTAANLISNLHRHQEADFSSQLLSSIFANQEHFKHHLLLPKSMITSDEGAANHNRLCASHDKTGINLFIYGKKALGGNTPGPKIYPARQTQEACEAIARSHLLNPEQIVFARQNPEAIDKGVFHNDVISVANESVYLFHEQALADQKTILDELKAKATFPLTLIELSKDRITLEEAVLSYLFNSQLITLPHNQGMTLIAPIECQQSIRIKSCIDELISDAGNPVHSVHYLDLRQSMRNGGGPACLRLRVPVNEHELAAMHQPVLINHALLDTLERWVLTHYRSELKNEELIDPQLINESFIALDELTQILKLGSLYPFQRERTL
jgi:succinylarginine dihydrolase